MFSPFSPVLDCALGLAELQACPFPDVVFPPLCLPCLLPPFTVPCKMVLARPDEREAWPYHCSQHLFTIIRSSCGPIACWILAWTSSLVTWSLCEMCYYLVVALPFHGLYSSVELYCEGPWYISIQEDGCDKEAHQLYLGTERNTPVIPNWFQPCQSCCCLCYPGEYLWLGTLIHDSWAQVLEACDCLKLLSIHFDLCVDVSGVVCHQLGPLGTDLYAVGCGGFVKTLN